MNYPDYTFVSVSTAKPGRLEDLIRITQGPTLKMDKKSDGLLAYQVGVDRERNTVIVWSTFDKKETLYKYLATQEGVAECAKDLGYKINFKSFTVTDAQNADEAFITSATTFVTPVIKINDNKISKGEPGKFTKALRERYIQKAREIAI